MLRAHGYRTAAFIGSDFLDQRFGLDQGFDLYDSPFNLEAAERANPFTMTLRRDGALVVRAARQWLDANRSQAAFAFVHLYDLHIPYTLPESAARARSISPYDAQLVYVDDVLGRFQQALKAGGWWDKSLIVLLSDHGEGLGDHGESDHGYFIYESTLWVPLIVHWPAGTASYPATTAAPRASLTSRPPSWIFYICPHPHRSQAKADSASLSPVTLAAPPACTAKACTPMTLSTGRRYAPCARANTNSLPRPERNCMTSNPTHVNKPI